MRAILLTVRVDVKLFCPKPGLAARYLMSGSVSVLALPLGTRKATITKPPELRHLTATWKLNDASDINCIAVWAQATLTEGVELSALDAASWQPIVYMIRPFEKDRGALEFKLDLSAKSNYWTASLSSKGERETQAYYPVLAYAALQGHMR